jgi:D-sedoheptulose 7-phosphate isomerase
MAKFGSLAQHLVHLRAGLASLERHGPTVDEWGRELARLLADGHRLLAAGNGGSAAEAQHLTAELVGRFEAPDRPPLSAIALHAETSSVTAIGNDFGLNDIFARQVRAHGRPGDVLVLLSTSGRSENLLAAAAAAIAAEIQVWALTGPRPNPLAAIADRSIAVRSPAPTAVQEVHLVAVHALCSAVEHHLTAAHPSELEEVAP